MAFPKEDEDSGTKLLFKRKRIEFELLVDVSRLRVFFTAGGQRARCCQDQSRWQQVLRSWAYFHLYR